MNQLNGHTPRRVNETGSCPCLAQARLSGTSSRSIDVIRSAPVLNIRRALPILAPPAHLEIHRSGSCDLTFRFRSLGANWS